MGERSFRKIVLAFNTLGLEKAEEIAGRIKVSVDRATNAVARGIKTRTRDAMKELRILKNAALERERVEKTAAAFKDRVNAQTLEALRRANDIRDRLENVAHLARGSLEGTSALLGALPAGGPIAAVIAAIVVPLLQKELQHTQEEQARRLDLLRLDVTARIDRLAYELDYERRLKEDPLFADAQARKAFELSTAEERAAAAGGWHEGADFLESFGE